jgi:ring-1,2-phenylacetyl-CoA epoxidase subunit PaaD
VDLGIVTGIVVDPGNDIRVTLTPTFAGCPALKIMETLVEERLLKLEEVGQINVSTSFDITWTTDMISEEGLKALKSHGLAPPARNCADISMEIFEHVPCPYCGSANTVLNSPFGPTLCRSLHYCNNCLQAFEGFKPLTS